MTDYQTIADKVKDFLTFKSQIQSMESKLAELGANPPHLVDKEVLTWEEAVSFAQSEEEYKKELHNLKIGIENRQNIIRNKEKEVGEMLPIKDKYILFEIEVEGQIEKFKIGYFPSSYGFRMEKMQ